jgi:toxin-antitoxin system PIN domain toxin
VILIDANLLIYAADEDCPNHQTARGWLEETLSGSTQVGLAWIVILAFMRLTTRRQVMHKPLSLDEASAYVDSWLEQPFVQPVVPGSRHWTILRDLLSTVGTAGNLTSDAHVAALAIEIDCPVFSTDGDFRKFPGVTCVNPLAS